MVDGAFFQDEVEQRKIMAVPMLFQNGEHIGQGRMTLEEIVAKLDSSSSSKDLENSNAKEVFDVLVIEVTAGNTVAIYAARKGIHTGISGRTLADKSWMPWTLKIQVPRCKTKAKVCRWNDTMWTCL